QWRISRPGAQADPAAGGEHHLQMTRLRGALADLEGAPQKRAVATQRNPQATEFHFIAQVTDDLEPAAQASLVQQLPIVRQQGTPAAPTVVLKCPIQHSLLSQQGMAECIAQCMCQLAGRSGLVKAFAEMVVGRYAHLCQQADQRQRAQGLYQCYSLLLHRA